MTWHTLSNNAELSTMQMIQTFIVPTKMLLNIDLENATSRFIHNGMKPNPDKYQAIVLGKTEDKLNFKLADIDIKTTDKTCLLGVVIDNELKFNDHISSICHKVSAQINALNRLKNILPFETKESLYRAFILPYTAKIEKVNERALRYLFKSGDPPVPWHRWFQSFQMYLVACGRPDLELNNSCAAVTRPQHNRRLPARLRDYEFYF